MRCEQLTGLEADRMQPGLQCGEPGRERGTSVRFQWLAVVMMTTMCGAETVQAVVPGAAAITTMQSAAMTAQTTAPAADLPGTITVPAGTTVAMTLVGQIKSKSTKPGDTVRAVVAFPVTVGTQLAIPAGTYVDGIVNSVTTHGNQSRVEIHFTRLLFSNGYAVVLDATSTQAMGSGPDPSGLSPGPGPGGPSPVTAALGELAYGGAPGLGQTAPEPPPLPPLPSVGPSKGLIIGLSVGGAAAVAVVALLTAHHHGAGDYVLFDNGWQFQMKLQSPLTLDAGKVSAAAAMPVAQ